METWSVGNAVLQGMGLEMTKDFLFFDLVVMLLEEKVKKKIIGGLAYSVRIVRKEWAFTVAD